MLQNADCPLATLTLRFSRLNLRLGTVNLNFSGCYSHNHSSGYTSFTASLYR